MPGTSACFPDKKHGPCRQRNKQDSRADDAFAGAFLRNCLLSLAHAKHQKHPCGSTGVTVCILCSDAVAFASSTAREPGA